MLDPAWRKSSLTKFPPAPAQSRLRHHHDQAKLEIPIDLHRSPRGSCMGGFRTESLHLSGHPVVKYHDTDVDLPFPDRRLFLPS
jgi:hypothetical protein